MVYTYTDSLHDKSDLVLKHYGVIGMKWGVSKAAHYASKNDKLLKKAYKYDAKSAELTKKSEKAHNKYDLDKSNKAAIKSAKYAKSDLENTLSFAINRFLSTQINVHLRYDSSTPRIEGSKWHKLQLKEILSFGFAYNFKNL